jgi:subtilase family serine protease
MAATNPERGNLMTQHVREQVRGRHAVGSLPAERVLTFDMLLPSAAPQQLDQFLADVYNPASVNHRHFLTPAQFTARFGPSEADWDELVRFARDQGFTVTGGSRDEMDLRLAAPVYAIEAAFHVKFRLYDHPTESRTFYSVDSEPTVAMQAAVWHISGLDNFATPQPRLQARSAVAAHPLTSTGGCPGNSYCGSDMRAAYYGPGSLTGAGQSIGLVEFYGYNTTDLNTYFSNSGQSNRVPVNGISTDGTPVACVYSKGCDDTEQTLDITQALGMAPGLAQLNVYVGSSDTAILSAMSVAPPGSVTGKVDAQISCSWGWGPADPATDDPIFKKFAAQGQSFFTAAGDSAAYTSASQAVYPADDANVTVVGGSDLATTGPGGAWSSESAWSDGGGGYFAADGIPIPTWQAAAIATFNSRSAKAGSAALRNSPDVAGEANFDFYVCADQQGCSANRYGGTSFAAPMWAGYMALVNQQAALNGQSSIGFLNATLYALGNAGGGTYSAAFHDIEAGGNGYAAVPGFDLATGWGSPNGAGLIAALTASAKPNFSLTATGTPSVPAGGSGSMTLTSAVAGGFNSSIALAAGGQPVGVTVSFSPASITGAGSSSISFQVASTVPAGSYSITLTGTGSTTAGGSKITATTTATLTVTAPNYSLSAGGSVAVVAGSSGAVSIGTTASGGFNSAIALSAAGQPQGVTVGFSPASITGTGASSMNVQVAATAAAGVYPITVTAASGGLVHVATVSLTVVVPGYSLAVNTGSLSLVQGTSGSATLSSTTTGGFAAPIALTAAGQPAGISVAFSPASIAGGGSSTITVTVSPAVAAGTYPVLLSGTSGTSKQSVPLTVSVGAASFSIAGPASSMAVEQGGGAAMTLATTLTGQLSAPVVLKLSGQPAGVVVTLGSSSLVPPGAVPLTIAVSATAAPGSYPITVSGASGTATASFTLTLVVGAINRPTFVFGVGTTALTVTHGTTTSFPVQTALTGAMVPSISLSLSGLPTGVTASFSSSTLNGAGVSTVTLTAASTAKGGTAVLTLAAASGGVTESSTVNLLVN